LGDDDMQLTRQVLKFWRKLFPLSHHYLSADYMVSHPRRLRSWYIRDFKFSQH